jgi:hypothetical protein
LLVNRGPGVSRLSRIEVVSQQLTQRDAAYDAVLRLRHASDLLASLDPAAAAHAVDRLRATLVAHHTDSGVLFDSHAWIVTAHRA